jgi:hypothetical protein
MPTFRQINPYIIKSYIIGTPGVPGCDYNFTAVANSNNQSIQLPSVPAGCPVTIMYIQCLEGDNYNFVFVGAGTANGNTNYSPLIQMASPGNGAQQQILINPANALNDYPAEIIPSEVWFNGQSNDTTWDTLEAYKFKLVLAYFDTSSI